MSKEQPDKANEARQNWSKYIAIVVRNTMEDFHTKYLSDKQMKELNPIIRNAIYTAIYACDHQEQSSVARDFVEFNVSMIPEYWEAPKLLIDV